MQIYEEDLCVRENISLRRPEDARSGWSKSFLEGGGMTLSTTLITFGGSPTIAG